MKEQIIIQTLLAKQQKYTTKHILHLLLSLVTVGLWIPFWILVAISNGNERVKAQQKIDKIIKAVN